MFELQLENKNGLNLKLTQNESKYQVVSIDGFQPPSATINTSEVTNMDGAKYKSSFLNVRNIVLLVQLKGNVEENRLRLYEIASTNEYCKIYYKNNSRNIYCEGYVETIENDLFSNSQTVQVSILCPNPYLFELNQIYVDISKTFDNFEFPFAIEKNGVEFSTVLEEREVPVYNVGEVATGLEITLTVDGGTVLNPVIYNVITGEFLKLNTQINKGEVITINTNTSKKSIKKYVDGKEQNIINTLARGSTWHKLKVGTNVFTYGAEIGEIGLHVSFDYNNLYKGV